MMWGFGGIHFIGIILGNILFALIIAAIIVFIIRVTRRGSYYHNYYHGESKSSALNILQERYAKGEITKEQYDNMKKDLGLN